MAADIDTLRILVATDCHVGYLENDEIRRYDSFNAFEEICSIASHRQVDFLLLGGDLFHENKPSRSTLVRTIEILRKYCMNDKPIQFQVVSDQTINFPNKFGLVNYEDPNFNVGLPVFTIHGNHDDPAGVDNLSAIDILAACNLVNYFGKVALGGSGVGNIALHPILLRKGSTNVALYGLGNIRDERLNRMFQTPHAVQWIRPESTEDCPIGDWFNIFVLHQNRVKANPKNAINEHMLAKFLDFVIWGHEHECLVDPQEVLGMDFHITQPGSSVATSLIDGESKAKHVLLLEIKGNHYRPTKIPLKSVRPFKYKNVSLQDAADLDANDATAVLEYLDQVVQDLIAEAAEEARPDLMLPLVRLRVDYTGFTTINPQRFGQKFVGKVANPHDILLFTKASKRRTNADGKIEEEKHRPEELNQQNIEALLAESNLKMEILPMSELGLALHKFVNKDDKLAFTDCLQENLDDTQHKLVEEALTDKLQEDDVVVKVSEHMQQREKEAIPKFKEASSSTPTPTLTDGRFSSLDQRTSQGGPSRSDADEPFSDDERTTEAAKRKAPAKRAAPAKDTESARGRGRGRGRGSRGSQGGLTQTTLNVIAAPRPPKRAAAASRAKSVSDDDASEPDEESEDEVEEPAQKIKRASARASQRGRKPAAASSKRGAASSSVRGTRSTYVIDDDVEDDDEDDAGPKKATQSTPSSQKRSSWGSLRS